MFDIHIHRYRDKKILKLLRALMAQGNSMATSLEVLTQKIEDLKQKVARNTSVVDSAKTLLSGLSQQLKDALAANDTAVLQSTVADLISQLDADDNGLADAVAANTTPAPVPPIPSPPAPPVV